MGVRLVKSIKFKQEKPFGCGFFALANLFDDEYFAELGRSESISRIGNDSFQLNNYLHHKGIALHPLYQNLILKIELGSFGSILHPEEDNGKKLPVMMSIKGKTLNHFVACVIDSNGEIEVFDSLKDKTEVFESIDDIWKTKGEILCIQAFYNIRNNFSLGESLLLLSEHEHPNVLYNEEGGELYKIRRSSLWFPIGSIVSKIRLMKFFSTLGINSLEKDGYISKL